VQALVHKARSLMFRGVPVSRDGRSPASDPRFSLMAFMFSITVPSKSVPDGQTSPRSSVQRHTALKQNANIRSKSDRR
jgi:hypothetical protein